MDCFDRTQLSTHLNAVVAVALLLGLVLVTALGCPDYSHQAPRPDYSSMTDEGGAVVPE